MPEWNDDIHNFMRFWFEGFSEGLDSIDAPASKTLLSACGRACARSYTAGVFQEAWRNSSGMQEFLAALSVRFPEGSYTLVRPGAVEVRYSGCSCDLVRLGLVTTLLLCQCSAQNLESNFTAGLGQPVRVTLEDSILRGGECCKFTVTGEF